VFKVLVQQLYRVYGNFGGHFVFTAIFNEVEECRIYQMLDFFLVMKIGLNNVCVQMTGFRVITVIVFSWRPYWKMADTSDTFADVALWKLFFWIFL